MLCQRCGSPMDDHDAQSVPCNHVNPCPRARHYEPFGVCPVRKPVKKAA